MIEDGLREGLARGMGAKISVESEGLHDREVGLDSEERCSWTLLLAENVATSSGKNAVDTTHGTFRYLNLDQEHWLKKTRFSKEGSSVKNTTSSWDKLSTTTMDGIGV
jgi:hypothetical protein